MNDAQQKEYRQKFARWEQGNYDLTIGDLLLNHLPGLFHAEIDNDNKTIKPAKQFNILCHGMKLDLKTPLYWLQLNMSYLDNFVYISFHSPY